jgi:Carboxypeptidase regulatory-like domain
VTIRGVVLDRATGEPVHGASVRLVTAAGSWDVVTAADGTWTVASPPNSAKTDVAGRTLSTDSLIVRAEGYLPHRSWVATPSELSSTCARAIHLVRVAASVHGRVVDPDGTPVPGARVGVSEGRAYGWVSGETTADASGEFGPLSVASGRVSIRVEAPARRITYRELTIVDGKSPAPIEIRLCPARIGRGRVIDDSGRPIEGANIDTERETDSSVRTGADGRFVWLIRDGSRAYVRVRKVGYFAADDIVHEVDAYRESLIVVRRGWFAEGVVLNADGTPATGATLIRFEDDRIAEASALSDAAGRYRIGPLPPGAHPIRISKARIPLGRARIEIGPGGDTTGVVIRLPELVAVEGVVVDAIDGRPLADVRVGERGGRDLCPPVRTDADGRFRILVGKTETPWRNPGTTFFRDGHGLLRRVRRYDPDGPVRIEMVPVCQITLRAVNEAGEPVVGADVIGGRVDPLNTGRRDPPGFRRTRALTGPDGRAVLAWPVGYRSQLRAEHPRWGRSVRIVSVPSVETHDIGNLVLRSPKSKPFLMVRDEQNRPVTNAVLQVAGTTYPADEDGCIRMPPRFLVNASLHAPGRERRRISEADLDRERPPPFELTLRPGASIRGRVVDSRGRGMPDFTVVCGPWTAPSDHAGRFRFDGVPIGRAVKVGARGFPFSGRFDWTLAAPGPGPVVLRWPGHGRIRIRPAGGRHGGGSAAIRLLDRRLENGECAMSNGDPLWEGDEIVLSVPAGLLDVRLEVWPGARQVFSPVRVREGEEIPLDYGFPVPGTLHGRIVDTRSRPVPGARIVDARTGRMHAITDADGEVRLSRPDGPLWPVPAGPIRLVINADGFAPVSTEILDTTKHPDVSRVLTPGGAVRVTIRRDEDLPEFVRLRLLSDRGPHSGWTHTGGGRTTLIEHVTPGRRRIEIRGMNRMPVFEDVDIIEGRTCEVDVRLPPR